MFEVLKKNSRKSLSSTRKDRTNRGKYDRSTKITFSFQTARSENNKMELMQLTFDEKETDNLALKENVKTATTLTKIKCQLLPCVIMANCWLKKGN